MAFSSINHSTNIKKQKSPKKSSTAGSIMLVDDNEIILTTLRDYLVSIGYHVIACQNGKDALVEAKKNKPSLIIMDIQMPEMDGIETTSLIKKENGLSQIPIIALTALTMKSDRERCMAVGIDEYISKPVSLQNLAQIIENHLQTE